MKKLFVAILAVFYLGTSAGATLQLHYCMDKLVDWKLWSGGKKDNKCSSCGMVKNETTSNGCCKDEHKQIKLENDHRAADGYQQVQLLSVIIPLQLIQLPLIDLPAFTDENPANSAPLRSSGVAVYIRNEVFRI